MGARASSFSVGTIWMFLRVLPPASRRLQLQSWAAQIGHAQPDGLLAHLVTDVFFQLVPFGCFLRALPPASCHLQLQPWAGQIGLAQPDGLLAHMVTNAFYFLFGCAFFF